MRFNASSRTLNCAACASGSTRVPGARPRSSCVTSIVTTWCDWNPGSTDFNSVIVRSSRPAANTRSSESAICAVTRERASLRVDPAVVRPVPAMAGCRSTRLSRSAGSSPVTSVASITAPATTAATRMDAPGSRTTVKYSIEIMEARAGVRIRASSSPIPPPSSESRAPSVASCRTSRLRVPPMAALVASSRVRASPRASRSVATFDMAITRNTATIDRTIHNGSSNVVAQHAETLGTREQAHGVVSRRGSDRFLARSAPEARSSRFAGRES